jgi:4-hydroxy-3-methylbut-2-enyl diphosphate reductase
VKDFHLISKSIQDRAGDCIVENTICEDTWMRQDEAKELARTVDSVIVVGGKASSNTKHLAELATHYGKPVQYVETAAELDLSRFTGAETVGVLAGASTPTWLVDEVVDVLEQLGDAPSRLTRFVYAAFGTPMLLALGAAAMTLGTLAWLALGRNWHFPVITGTYVLAMYLLAPYLDPMGLGAKGPGRARFLERNRKPLLATALLALATTLGTAALLGLKPLLVVSGASVLGIGYKFRLKAGARTISLSAIPGSKDVLVAAALGVVAVAMPLWHLRHPFDLRALAALALVTVLVFARTVIYDIIDMQNDQIIGKETLPILIGKVRAKAVVAVALAGLLGLMGWLTFAAGPGPRAWLAAGIFLACIAYPLVYLWLYHERFTTGRPGFEVKAELSFYLVGLLALL